MKKSLILIVIVAFLITEARYFQVAMNDEDLPLLQGKGEFKKTGGSPPYLTTAVNYWKWDCESTTSATTSISGFSGGSKLVSTDPRSGMCCLQHDAIGNDDGNQQAGARVSSIDIGTLTDGKWIYYRWWMKIDGNFKFNNSEAKMKASRVKASVTPAPFSPPWTGYISRDYFSIDGCSECNPSRTWDVGGARIPFNSQAMAGKGWHEYIVGIKKQTGVSGSDGEFHLWVDKKEIGSGIKNLHWTNKSDQMKEAWASWMVRPYFQLNGTPNDGGLIWIDDISTDDRWNTTIVN